MTSTTTDGGLPDLTEELIALGKETACDAWVEYAGRRTVIPNYPELCAWRKAGADLRLLEADRVLTDSERRVFVTAYRDELCALAEEDALCAVCRAPAAKCDGKTCQHIPTGNAENLSRATVARIESAAEIDHVDDVGDIVAQSASKAMCDLLVASITETQLAIRKRRVPAAPMVLVDEGLRALAAMRADFGEPAAHIERDPLATLVAELRYGRLPRTFVHVIRAFAVATAESSDPDYDDGHTRRQSAYSLIWLCCELAEYAAMVVEGEEPDVWAVKGVKLAGTIASQLVRCRIDHALDEGPVSDARRAAISSAADEFIAGLAHARSGEVSRPVETTVEACATGTP